MILKIRPKIIVLVGPNASGKSGLAVKLAKRFNGEIISADSRQAYRGLDIATGKVPGKWRIQKPLTRKRRLPTNKRPLASWKFTKRKIFVYRGIPHYCIDFVPPRRVFTAADFKKCAAHAIKDIAARGRIPILVGGTGFYIDAAIYRTAFPEVPPNAPLRRALAKKSTVALFLLLQKRAPLRAKTIDRKNPRRLIRAIEIARALGSVPPIRRRPVYSTLWLGIALPKNVLWKKIHARLITRLRGGMIREAKQLRKNGMPWKRFYSLGLEYRFLADYLRGKIDKTTMTKNLEYAIRHYARRQITWFARNKKINWVSTYREAENLTLKFLAKKN